MRKKSTPTQGDNQMAAMKRRAKELDNFRSSTTISTTTTRIDKDILNRFRVVCLLEGTNATDQMGELAKSWTDERLKVLGEKKVGQLLGS